MDRACLDILGVDEMAGASAVARDVALKYQDSLFVARFNPRPPGQPSANPIGGDAIEVDVDDDDDIERDI